MGERTYVPVWTLRHSLVVTIDYLIISLVMMIFMAYNQRKLVVKYNN